VCSWVGRASEFGQGQEGTWREKNRTVTQRKKRETQLKVLGVLELDSRLPVHRRYQLHRIIKREEGRRNGGTRGVGELSQKVRGGKKRVDGDPLRGGGCFPKTKWGGEDRPGKIRGSK